MTEQERRIMDRQDAERRADRQYREERRAWGQEAAMQWNEMRRKEATS